MFGKIDQYYLRVMVDKNKGESSTKMKEINNKTRLSFTIAEWWGVIVAFVVGTVWLTNVMYNTQYKLELLTRETQRTHIETIERLNNMQMNFNLYVLKGKLEDVFVYYEHRDGIIKTNALADESELRRSIRDILNR